MKHLQQQNPNFSYASDARGLYYFRKNFQVEPEEYLRKNFTPAQIIQIAQKLEIKFADDPSYKQFQIESGKEELIDIIVAEFAHNIAFLEDVICSVFGNCNKSNQIKIPIEGTQIHFNNKQLIGFVRDFGVDPTQYLLQNFTPAQIIQIAQKLEIKFADDPNYKQFQTESGKEELIDIIVAECSADFTNLRKVLFDFKCSKVK